ncbi:MAG: 1-deoxy-D-xylulose-5-phosphate synthase, partial [Erysipelotrichia bacterium]|nr:1-deoxy-D-xylulose-5-phosphate synthase [Erysipelotrichia bacterium]
SLSYNHLDWSSVLSESLLRLAKTNQDILALTPAMSKGSKLDKFAKMYPERFFDCGIAEEHAMTFAASLALNGKRPFISVYSSFLQRAYDQINHDVARMDLPVVIGVDRAGLVGEDGETHHGVFDISALYAIPNLIITQPKDAKEAQNLMYSAFQQNKHPYIIRIPRGSVEYTQTSFEQIPCATWTRYDVKENPQVVVITYGQDVDRIINKAKINDLAISVVNARFIKPLDQEMLEALLASDLEIIVYETDMLHGGLSTAILAFNNDHGFGKVIKRIGIEDHYVPQGSLPQLRKREGIDLSTLFDEIMKYIH